MGAAAQAALPHRREHRAQAAAGRGGGRRGCGRQQLLVHTPLCPCRTARPARFCAGASEGHRRHDGELFDVLERQHRLGVLRSAGTQDMYQELRHGGGGRGGRGAGRGRGRGGGRGQWHRRGDLAGVGVRERVAADPEAEAADPCDPEAAARGLRAANAAVQAVAALAEAGVAQTIPVPCDVAAETTAVGCTVPGGASVASDHGSEPAAQAGQMVVQVKAEQGDVGCLAPSAAAADCDLALAQPAAVDARALAATPDAAAVTADLAAGDPAEPAIAAVTEGAAAVRSGAPAGAKRPLQRAAGGDSGPHAKAARTGHAAAPSKPCSRQPSLLHRLVAADVRQDRSVLLQAFRCVSRTRRGGGKHRCWLRGMETMQRSPVSYRSRAVLRALSRSSLAVCRFFRANNYLQDVERTPLQFPEHCGAQAAPPALQGE